MIIGIPFMVWTVLYIIDLQKASYCTTFINQLRKDYEAEMYMNIILDLIEDQKNLKSQIRLEGILKLHIKKIDDNKKDKKKILIEINECKPLSLTNPHP